MRAAGWFGVWTAIGAAYALGCISFIGVLVLPVAFAATIAVAQVRGSVDGLAGIVAGLGAPLLYVAWLNRAGPDPYQCHAIANGESCAEVMNPWPWLVAGTGFIVAGVALFACRHCARRA
jgi:hypothetical protein